MYAHAGKLVDDVDDMIHVADSSVLVEDWAKVVDGFLNLVLESFIYLLSSAKLECSEFLIEICFLQEPQTDALIKFLNVSFDHR